MSQTKVLVGIFVLFLLALPLASADITDSFGYYPFEHISVVGEWNGALIGADGHVVASDSADDYNYGRNGSIYFQTTGGNPYIDVPASVINSYDDDSSLSISLWYWADETNEDDLFLSINGENMEVGFRAANQVSATFWGQAPGSGLIHATTDITGWHHLVITYEAKSAKLYFDNVLEDTHTYSSSATTTVGDPLYLGRRSSGYYHGKLDDVIVYNSILDATDIAELWNGGAGTRADETTWYNTSLVNYYNDMDGMKDMSNNGNNINSTVDMLHLPQSVPGIIDQEQLSGTNFRPSAYAFQNFGDVLGSCTDDLTISFWANIKDKTDWHTLFSLEGQCDLMAITDFGADGYCDGGVSDPTGEGEDRFCIALHDGSDPWKCVCDPSTSVDDGWVHYMYTMESGIGNEIELFKNGVFVESFALEGELQTDNEQNVIGRRLTGYYYDGQVQDFNMWDAILDSDDALTLYQNGTPTQLAAVLIPTDMIYNNSFTYNKGDIMRFDGSTDHLKTGISATAYTEISVAAWVAHDGGGGSYPTIIGATDTGSWDDGFGLYFSGGDLDFWVDDYTDEATYDWQFESGSWHHVVGTFDGSNVRLYVDGNLEDTQAGVSWGKTSDVEIRIGCLSEGADSCGGTHWDGSIDEVRIFNRSLNQSEINELYTYTQLTQSMVLLSPLDNSDLFDASNDFICEWTGDNVTINIWNVTAGTGQWLDAPTDYSAYYPFEYTSSYIRYVNPINGSNGHVVGLDSDAYNYGRNGSFDFDGDDKWIETYVDDTKRDSTFSFWAKSTESGQNGVFSHSSITSNSFFFNYNAGRPLLYTGANCYVYFTSATEEDDGDWHYWTVYFDATTIGNSQLYVDNVEVSQDTVITTSCPSDAYAGSLQIGTVNGITADYTGQLDEFYVVPYNMTIAERTELYNSGAGKRADESSYYNLSNTLYYNDMDGLKDQSDNGNMLITGGDPFQDPEGVPGIIDNSLLTATSFNGNNDFVTGGLVITDYGISASGQDIAVSIWYYAEDENALSSLFGCENANDCFRAIINTDGSIQIGSGDGVTWTNIGNVEPDNPYDNWNHLIVSYDYSETNWSLYLNGVYKDNLVQDWTINSLNLMCIGSDYDSNSCATSYFNKGNLQDFNLYNTTLNQTEVTALYQSGSPTQLSRDIISPSKIAFNNSLTYNKGTVMKFDGSDDYIQAFGTTSLDTVFLGDVTVSGWINTDSYTTFGAIFSYSYAASGSTTESQNALFVLSLGTPTGCIRVGHEYSTGSNSFENSIICNLDLSTWYHILITRNITAKEYDIYLNGVYNNTYSYTNNPTGGTSDELYMGKSWWDGDRLYDGSLDDFRVYDYVLNQAEITAVYEYGQLIGGSSTALAYNNTVSDPVGQTTWNVTLPQPMPLGTYNGTGTEITQDYLWNCEGNPWAPSNYSFTFHPLICTGGSEIFNASGPTDYNAYYPFEYTSSRGIFNGDPTGTDGIVVANDSDAYNYGRNGSIDFDGSSDYIKITPTPILSGDISVASWVYVDVYTAQNAIMDIDGDVASAVILLAAGDSTGEDYRWVIKDNDGDQINLEASGTSNLGEWVHFVGTWDATTFNASIYRNGVLIDSAINTNIITSFSVSDSMYLGVSAQQTRVLNGKLDDVSIYNIALNQTEITELYNDGNGIRADETSFYNESQTPYYNDMDGLKDQSDNGNDLTTGGEPQQDPEGVPGIIDNPLLTATSFNGADDIISFTGLSGLPDCGSTPVDFSVSWWQNHKSLDNTQYVWELYETCDIVAVKGIWGSGNQLCVGITVGSPGSWQPMCDTATSADEWVYYTYTYNTSAAYLSTLYRNGVSINSTTGQIYSGVNSENTIGGSQDAPGSSMNGEIQDFNIYNTTLSSAQALSLYQGGAPTQLARDIIPADIIYNNSLTYTKGTVMNFDGVDDSITAVDFLEGYDEMTLSFWFNPAKIDTTYQYLFFKDEAGNVIHNLYCSIGNVQDQVKCQLQNGVGQENMVATIEDVNTWYHLVLTSDGATDHRLYIDGVSEYNATLSWTINGNTNTAYFGANSGSGSALPYEGKMDDIRWYNRILNQTEITELYEYTQLSEPLDCTPGSLEATFSSSILNQPLYTNEALNCEASWTGATSIIDSVNISFEWFNESASYDSTNYTDTTAETTYSLTVGSDKTLALQNWTCNVSFDYYLISEAGINQTNLSNTVTIQNSFPTIVGNMTWTDYWFNPLNRTINCTDLDTEQTLTMFIADNQSNFYSAGATVDLSAYTSNVADITYDAGSWYVLDYTNTQVIKFDSSWTWVANYSLYVDNINPSGFFRDGFARWYVTDWVDSEVYEYDNNFTAIGTCLTGCSTGETGPQDLYRLGDYWFIVRDDGSNTDVYRYVLTEGVGFGSKTLMDNTAAEDINMKTMWYWDPYFYLYGTEENKVWKYNYTGSTWTELGTDSDVLCTTCNGLYRDNYYWYLAETATQIIYQYYSNFTSYVNMTQTGPNTTPISALFNHTFVSTDVGNHYINISCNDSVGHTDNETFYQYIYATNYTNHTAMSPANGTVWFEVPSLLCSGGSDPSNSSTYGFEYYSDTDMYLGYANADVSLSWINASYNFHDWSCRPCLAEGVGCGAFGPQFSITPAVFDVCPEITVSNSLALLNFTFLDEMTDLPLNATAVVDVDYTSEYETGTTKTYTFQYINTSHNPYYDFCVAPAAIPMILGYQSFIYSSTEGATTYPARDFGYTYNVSSLYNQTLYLLDETTGTYSTFITVDQIEDVIPFVSATVERQNLVPGEEWTLVASGDTDASGAITFWLNPDFYHRFIFEKTGYESFNNLIKPTQAQYIIGMGPTDIEGVSMILEGISWTVSPLQNYLSPGTNYTFGLDITAVGDNLLYNCKLELFNNSPGTPQGTGALIGTTGEGCAYLGTSGLGDSLNTTMIMPDNPVYGKVSVKINGTSSAWIVLEWDAAWLNINWTENAGNTLQKFFSLLGSIVYSEEDIENLLSKIWFFFIMVAILLSVFTFKTGEEWQSPLSTLWLVALIFGMASYMGFFSPGVCPYTILDPLTLEIIADSIKCFYYDHGIALLFGWIFTGYMFSYLAKRSTGEL